MASAITPTRISVKFYPNLACSRAQMSAIVPKCEQTFGCVAATAARVSATLPEYARFQLEKRLRL
eukprot:3876827-Rhodomonas_salina.1